MACKRKRFRKTKLCTGDLRHLVKLQLREISSDWDNPGITFNFTDVIEVFAAIETISTMGGGTSRFQGVALDQNATHIVWFPFDTSIEIPEDGNHFFLLNDGRRLRVLRSTIDGEDRDWFAIQCSERGDSDKDASSS